MWQPRQPLKPACYSSLKITKYVVQKRVKSFLCFKKWIDIDVYNDINAANRYAEAVRLSGRNKVRVIKI